MWLHEWTAFMSEPYNLCCCNTCISQPLSICIPETLYINAWLQSVLVYGSLFLFCTLRGGQRSGSAAEQLVEIQCPARGHFGKAVARWIRGLNTSPPVEGRSPNSLFHAAVAPTYAHIIILLSWVRGQRLRHTSARLQFSFYLFIQNLDFTASAQWSDPN